MKREIYGVKLDNNHSIDAQNNGDKEGGERTLLGIAMIAETLLGRYIDKHAFICVYMCIYINLRLYLYLFIYIDICMYIYVYIIYIYIYQYTHIYKLDPLLQTAGGGNIFPKVYSVSFLWNIFRYH
jgi:hypothetical protein